MAKRKKAKAATKARTTKTPSASTPKAKPAGSISSGIYDAIGKLMADGKLTRTAAFRQLAKQTGRKEGTVAVNYYYAAKKRGAKRPATKKAAANVKTRKPSAKAAEAQARPKSSVSGTVYDAIEKLVANNAITRAAAFRQLAKTSGRNEGTISVNYYYAAKKRGAKLRKRRGRPKTARGARRSGASSNIESVLKSLAELIRAQESELNTLRREDDRFAAIRKLVGS